MIDSFYLEVLVLFFGPVAFIVMEERFKKDCKMRLINHVSLVISEVLCVLALIIVVMWLANQLGASESQIGILVITTGGITYPMFRYLFRRRDDLW